MIQPLPYAQEITRFLKRHHYESLRVKAALIDMDGTLYDSMPNHTAAWHRMMTELGVTCSRDEFYLYEGATGAATIDKLFLRAFGRNARPSEVEEYYKRKTEYFRELPPVRLMPGASEMLRILSEVGIRRVLVTGSGQKSVLDKLDADFPGAFLPGMRITSHDVTHGKPHPEPYIRAMQLVQVRPSESMVIENAPLGVESGDRAGAFTVGITTGPIPREAMEEAGAAIVFSSMTEFTEKLPLLLLSMLMVKNDN